MPTVRKINKNIQQLVAVYSSNIYNTNKHHKHVKLETRNINSKRLELGHYRRRTYLGPGTHTGLFIPPPTVVAGGIIFYC